MKDIQEVRKKNFIRLLAEFRFKSEASELFGFQNSSYVSQMKSGHRAIGEKTARKIEKAAGKPELWLDQDEDLSPTKAALVQKVKDFPEEHLYALSAFVDSLSKRNRHNQ